MASLREVSSLERENLVVFDYFSVSEICPDRGGLIKRYPFQERYSSLYKSGIREVSSLERENLVVFDYFSVSEIWPDKRGGLKRGILS